MGKIVDYDDVQDKALMEEGMPFNWLMDITSFPIYETEIFATSIEIFCHEYNFWGKPVKQQAHLRIELVEDCNFKIEGEFGYLNLGFKYYAEEKHFNSICNYEYLLDRAWHIEREFKEKNKNLPRIYDNEFTAKKIEQLNSCLNMLKFFETEQFALPAMK
ncbi:MAG: hypothetical protein H7Y13_03850 [Sphingobacteriaceae bacterium]|nr:hypothetical protein [Sphingobacteriaceae bacterium]